MAKVEEILNSTAFKISTAEDSLSKTRFSVEVFRNETQEKFTQLDTQIAEAKNNSNMMFYIAIVISIIMFVLLLIQNGKLKKSMLSHTIQSDIKVKEAVSKMEEDLNTQQKFSSNEINNVKLQLLKEFKLENITLNTKIETLINTLEDLKNNK
jgi:RsiW-degrading membrane proteinase PrsW (M82 family)